jgi:CBS-domain-containing membrane protein
LGHDDLRIFLLNGAAARAMEFPQYVRPGDTLADLLPILMHGDKDCVWVVEDEERMRLIGVVSQTDVMLKLLETIESEEPFPPEAEPT